MPLDASISLLADQLSREYPTPETMKLLQVVWPKVSPDIKSELLSYLGDPPTSPEIGAWRDDKELHKRLLRQWRWLTGGFEDLPEPWKTTYRQLSSEFGSGDPEARRYKMGIRVGSISPLSAEEISELGPERFADWVTRWDPPPRGWEAPTPAGLGGELSQAVRASPTEWLDALPGITERLRQPTYVRGVLAGLREALTGEGATDAWDRLVPTLELLASEPWPVERLTEDDFHADPDWAECQGEITRMIQEAVDRDTAFDDITLERLWSVLLATMRKREKESGVSGDDLLTEAINKMSTRALQAMFSIALSVSRRKRDVAAWAGRLAGAVDEELSNQDAEAELAGGIVASLYPQFLHVCGDSANDYIPRLFGPPESGGLKTGALKTLLEWARPITNDMLARFRPYIVAYLALERPEDDRAEKRDAIRWLVIAYIRQLEGQKDPGELLTVLARPSRISEGAEFFGRVLRDTADPGPELLEAAIRFWDQALRSAGLSADAFQGFGWWAESKLDDQDWLDRTYATLKLTHGRLDWDDQVAQRLIRLREYPDAWKSLSLLVKGADERWTVSYWARNLHDLFKETSDSTGEIRALRSELAERLLERELLDFREYLG